MTSASESDDASPLPRRRRSGRPRDDAESEGPEAGAPGGGPNRPWWAGAGGEADNAAPPGSASSNFQPGAASAFQPSPAAGVFGQQVDDGVDMFARPDPGHVDPAERPRPWSVPLTYRPPSYDDLSEPSASEPPLPNPPRVEPPRVEPPRAEQPRAEQPRAEPPRAEQPRAEAPRFEAPRFEAPRVEAPRFEPPAFDVPPMTAPPLDTPAFGVFTGADRSWLDSTAGPDIPSPPLWSPPAGVPVRPAGDAPQASFGALLSGSLPAPGAVAPPPQAPSAATIPAPSRTEAPPSSRRRDGAQRPRSRRRGAERPDGTSTAPRGLDQDALHTTPVADPAGPPLSDRTEPDRTEPADPAADDLTRTATGAGAATGADVRPRTRAGVRAAARARAAADARGGAIVGAASATSEPVDAPGTADAVDEAADATGADAGTDAGAAPATGRAGRNLPVAIAVGAGLGALAVASLFTRPEAFVALVCLVAVLGVWELAGAMAAKEIMVPVVPLAVGSVGMLVSAYVAGEEGLLVSFMLTGLGVLLWRIVEGMQGALRDVTAGLFVAAYVPLLAGFSVLLLTDSPRRVVVFILVTVASDIGGYVAGVLAGRRPMAPTISPKKTWEGFAGSVLACLVVGVVGVVTLLHGPALAGLALGAAAVVTATLGDLAESMLKRDLKVKDMGTLLPGHGGLMDRLDSLLPTAPVAFLILHQLVH